MDRRQFLRIKLCDNLGNLSNVVQLFTITTRALSQIHFKRQFKHVFEKVTLFGNMEKKSTLPICHTFTYYFSAWMI